jgi:ATP-independent RNA helicase DbpA
METGFRTLAISPPLLSAVEALGFSMLTPIQAGAIPPLLAGQDVIGQSQTGSGKTVAFALPILERLAPGSRELQAMVLCPTRELSAQVAREFRKLGRSLPGLSVLVLAGGEPLRAQNNALERGVHVVVGTPGRVLDQLRRRHLKVHAVTTVVLDEADRMLSMGFQEDIEKILKALPTPRQTAFFSATFPDPIDALSKRHQQSPVWVRIEQEQQRSEIRQWVCSAEPERKLEALLTVLAQHPHESALVFANFKISVAKLEQALREANMSVAAIHGDLEQFDRDRVLAKFRNGSTRVLVATDVAARGLDIQDLDLVVNFDLPSQPETYVHRIGRTGRAGKAGLAISICASAEEFKLEAIQQVAGVTLERLSLEASNVGKATAKQSLERGAAMVTLRISGGRKQKMRPGDILGALTGEAGGLESAQVGKIEIHDNFAYVAVASAVAEAALRSLNAGQIKGRKFKATLEA